VDFRVQRDEWCDDAMMPHNIDDMSRRSRVGNERPMVSRELDPIAIAGDLRMIGSITRLISPLDASWHQQNCYRTEQYNTILSRSTSTTPCADRPLKTRYLAPAPCLGDHPSRLLGQMLSEPFPKVHASLEKVLEARKKYIYFEQVTGDCMKVMR